MHKTLVNEKYAFVVVFTLILTYFSLTNSLKIDNTFYTKCINLLKTNFVFVKEPPLIYLFFASFVYLSQFINNLFRFKQNNMIYFFNLLASLFICLNIFFIKNLFVNGKNKVSVFFFVIFFFVFEKNYEKISIINLNIFQFTILCLVLNFKRRKILKMIFLGLLVCSSWLGIIVFFNEFVFDLYKFYVNYHKLIRNYSLEKKKRLLKHIYNMVISLTMYLTLYISLFFIFFVMMKYNSHESEEMSLEFKSTMHTSRSQCDKYVLDRALVTLINQKSQSLINFDKKIIGKKSKDENSIFQVIKIHVENENYDPKNENNFLIQNKDYVKLMHYKTKKYLRSVVSKESKNKFFELELKNTEENTDDNDFFQIFFEDDYLKSRTTLFTLKHVTSGRALGIKLDKSTVAVSSESNISTRNFYIEDCYNEPYFKENLKIKEIKEKILTFPNLSFFQKFKEFHQKMTFTPKLEKNLTFECLTLFFIGLLIILNDLFNIFKNILIFNKSVYSLFLVNLFVLLSVIFCEVNKLFSTFYVLLLISRVFYKVSEIKKAFFLTFVLGLMHKLS